MIQIYKADNTDVDKNGDMTLTPTEATISVELNGNWEAKLEHPLDPDGRWKYIEEGAVVKMPSFIGTDQLFRIKSKEKSDSGVTAEMEPIFYDAMDDCFLVDIRPTNKNGQEALDLMTAPNSKYSGESNITRTATAYYQFKNLLEAINGDDENSFVNRWGGEILFDNFKVKIYDRVGADHGVELRYGKNIPRNGMSEEVDIRDVVTRIYPKAYNGYTMTNNGYVDSPLVGSYPVVKAAAITFDDVKMAEDAQEDDAENGITICESQAELDAALQQRCEAQYSAGLDKPKVTIAADMALLTDTDTYQDYAVLEEVSLGDTVHCHNSHLNITTDSRVIHLDYDAARKKVSSVVLGDFKYNYFDRVSSSVSRIDSVIRPDGMIMAEKIAGFLDGAAASLRAQYNVAKKQDVIAVLFENLDEDSPLYGAMAIGTQGLMISKSRTADGRDWQWTTAITANGAVADIILAGILSDKSGKNWWNLETGELHAGKASFSGEITGSTITGSKIQFLKNGKVYISLSENGFLLEDEEGNSILLSTAFVDTAGLGPSISLGNADGSKKIMLTDGYISLKSGNVTLQITGDPILDWNQYISVNENGDYYYPVFGDGTIKTMSFAGFLSDPHLEIETSLYGKYRVNLTSM